MFYEYVNIFPSYAHIHHAINVLTCGKVPSRPSLIKKLAGRNHGSGVT